MKIKISLWPLCQKIVLLFLTVFSMTFSWSVFASDPNLQQLIQKVDSLEANNQKIAQALNRLQEIQREFQSIRGHVESQQYLQKENDRVYSDLNIRVAAMEDKIDQMHQLVKEIVNLQKGGAEASEPAQSKEFEDFQNLLVVFNSKDYRNAASGFLGFLKKYPKSQYRPNAQFWVAEAYYSLGDYAMAIKQYQKLIEGYPSFSRLKEATYKQGRSFMNLKKYDEAKLFFEKVMASYPNSPESAKAQTNLHRIAEMQKSESGQGPSS